MTASALYAKQAVTSAVSVSAEDALRAKAAWARIAAGVSDATNAETAQLRAPAAAAAAVAVPVVPDTAIPSSNARKETGRGFRVLSLFR